MNNTTVEEIRLCEIRLDRTQSRSKIDPEAVQDYADLLREGVVLPPMIVYFDSEIHWLADGFHRHGAACNLGLETYPCEVRKGSWQEAVMESVRSNHHHGVRRTNDDKRHAVELAFTVPSTREMSDRYIAEECGVSAWLVTDVRRVIEHRENQVNGTSASETSQTRTGRDGKRRQVASKAVASVPVASDPVNGQLAAAAAVVPPEEKPADDAGTSFDTEQLDEQPPTETSKPKKPGKPTVSRKDRTAAQKAIGDLIRSLSVIGIYDEYAEVLSQIAERLKTI